jgi:hypothetical protein
VLITVGEIPLCEVNGIKKHPAKNFLAGCLDYATLIRVFFPNRTMAVAFAVFTDMLYMSIAPIPSFPA